MGYWVTDYLPRLDKNLNVLLVDHDPLSLTKMVSLLEQQFYNVTTTQQASVALSMIQEKGDRFDLVMANANMPDMDCFSFLHKLLKRNIAVIFMSSELNLDAATKASAGGTCYFLQKPISKDDLKYVWQHIYQRNTNLTKQTHKVNFMEKPKSRKESPGIKIADAIDLSRSDAAAVGYSKNSYINYQPMNYKGKEKKKQIEYYDSVVEDMKGINREKRIKYYSESSSSRRIMEKDDERREKYYISSDDGSRVVWNAERHRKFTYALNKLARPKLILKLMNEPCLTLRQVANHLQKYKAQEECIKRRRENKLASKSSSSARTQVSPLVQKQHHRIRRFRDGARLTSCLGADKLRPIAPKSTPPIPRVPVGEFVNCGLQMLDHNFQQVGFNYNYNSVPFNNSKEVGLYPYNIQPFEKEGNVQISEMNFPNVSTTTPMIDEIQIPDNFFDSQQQLDFGAFGIENQKATEHSGDPDFVHWGSDQLPTTFGNEGSQPLTEYADLILNVLDDDPYNLSSDLNLSDVDRYCEWLKNTVLQDGSGPDSFICGNAAGNAP